MIEIDLSADAIHFIEKLYGKDCHNYSEEKIWHKFPFESDKMSDHMDPKSYDSFKEFEKYTDLPSRFKAISHIIKAAFFLQIKSLKKLVCVCY